MTTASGGNPEGPGVFKVAGQPELGQTFGRPGLTMIDTHIQASLGAVKADEISFIRHEGIEGVI